MTEKLILNLNKEYSIRVGFDLETKDIDFWAISRVTDETLEHYGQDLFSLVESYGKFENHLEVFEETLDLMKVVFNWIQNMDIDALIAEHIQCERDERGAA